MKHIGNVKVLSVEEYTRKDKSKGFKVVAMSDENMPTIFYRPYEENPKPNDTYLQMLTYDRTLSAVIRYQPANK